jgi:tetratricopeptide (TPR) repeat protein
MADLHGRVGSIDEGIRLLAKTLPDARATSTEQHARVLLRLATLHGRRGDYRRAEALFQQGLDRRRRTSGLARLEHLFFLNERASLQVIVGKPETALSLCAEGLRLAAKEHDPRSRELALNLLATRANVHLRAHEYEKAIESFESSLEIAEAMGSQVNQAAILNNLGIVYNQCDRYAEAVAAFEEAEKTCVLLDEGPSLVSIHCNLAVIHAKLGDFAAAEERLAAAERLSPQAMGRRQEFFLAHSRGLVQLSAGRFASARESFDGALRLAEALGDAHVASFDDLYRCEALTFEGRYEEAERGLERLSKHAVAPRVRAMARARLDFLQAITGRSAEGRRPGAAGYTAGAIHSLPRRLGLALHGVGWLAAPRGGRCTAGAGACGAVLRGSRSAARAGARAVDRLGVQAGRGRAAGS